MRRRNMAREALVALILLTVPLAGCLDDETPTATEDASAGDSPEVFDRLNAREEAQPSSSQQAPAQQAPPEPSSGEPATTAAPAGTSAPPSFDSPVVKGARDDWYVVAVKATPEGGITAFDWYVPEGAHVPWAYNEVFDDDREIVVLETALILPEGSTATLDMWGLISFEEFEGALVPDGGHLAVATTMTAYTRGEILETMEEAVAVDPVFIEFWSPPDAGETIPLLLVARSSEPVEVGLAFRVMDRDPDDPEGEDDLEPAKDAAEFLAGRGASRPLGIPARAEASGVAMHGYEDFMFTGFTPENIYGFETVVGEPTYSWSAPPEVRALGGVATFEGSIDGAFERGYAAVMADYTSYAVGVSEAEALVELHGEAERAAVVAPDVMASLFLPVRGTYASAIGIGDGEGPSSVSIKATRAGATTWIQAVGMLSIEFGESLETLIGKPAKPLLESSVSSPIPDVGSERAPWEFGFGRVTVDTGLERAMARLGIEPPAR